MLPHRQHQRAGDLRHLGAGGNGKSTFLMPLLDLLCSYAEPADVRLLLGRMQRQMPMFRLQALVVPEIPKSDGVSEARMKILNGGDCVVSESVGEVGRFAPTHKFWLAGNEIVNVRGKEHVIWERLRFLPFEDCITEAERDPRVAHPGILRVATG